MSSSYAAVSQSLADARDHAVPCPRRVLAPIAPFSRSAPIFLMERAVKAGFYEKMPDEKIIYTP
jgi:hypothetical protein